MQDHLRGQEIYNEVMKSNLESGKVNVETLRISRDPVSVTQNLTERDDAFALMTKAKNDMLNKDEMKDIESHLQGQK
jgi:hypothetical protein